jgi:hypothetical protein
MNHRIHHPTIKSLYTRRQLNTSDPLLPPVPVVIPLAPVLDDRARLDPPPPLHLLPKPRPTLHKIKRISSSPWPSPSRRRRCRCHCRAQWAPQTSEEQMSTNSSKCTQASPLAAGATRRATMSSQRSGTPALNNPGYYPDGGRISEKRLRAMERGAEGRLPARQ